MDQSKDEAPEIGCLVACIPSHISSADIAHAIKHSKKAHGVKDCTDQYIRQHQDIPNIGDVGVYVGTIRIRKAIRRRGAYRTLYKKGIRQMSVKKHMFVFGAKQFIIALNCVAPLDELNDDIMTILHNRN